MTCPKCGLLSEVSQRARLLGARIAYVKDKSCPRCGFLSEEAKRDKRLRFALWSKLFAEDEGVPPEKHLEEWRRKEAVWEKLDRLLELDDRYLPAPKGSLDDG